MKKKLFTMACLAIFCTTSYVAAQQKFYTPEEAEKLRNVQKEKAVNAEQKLLVKIHHTALTQSDSNNLLKAIDMYKAKAMQFNQKMALDEVRKISAKLSLSDNAQELFKGIALASVMIESTGFVHKANSWKNTTEVFFANAKGLIQTITSQEISNNDTEQSDSNNVSDNV